MADFAESVTRIALLAHDLDTDPRIDGELDALLDATERARAERFAFPILRRRYRVAHAVLRCALGRWTGQPPASLQFERGPEGKPTLPGGPAFNLSHSANRLLLGISDAERLGVDVEVLRLIDDLEGMARHNFAADECAAVLACPQAERSEAFLRVWTRKEAMIKALGGGLSIPLQSFSVSTREVCDNALKRLDQPGEHSAAWCVRGIDGVAGCVAALAVDAPSFRLDWFPPEIAFFDAVHISATGVGAP